MSWTAFPLHPDTPEKGLTLEALFAGRMVDIPGMLARLEQVAAQEGLPFGARTMTFNSRLAQELGKWAETQGLGSAYHHAVFHAYFADGQNIGRVKPLIDICRSVGLPVKTANSVLQERSFRNAVDRDWNRSRSMDIRAVPTFAMNGRILVGAQSLSALDTFVSTNGAQRLSLG